jgi:hypothetical protein
MSEAGLPDSTRRDDEGLDGVAPGLVRDTPAEKAVRFGCGAALGALMMLGIVMTGLAEPIGMTGVLVAAGVLTVSAGLAGVARGEPAIRGLLKAIKWLA